MPAVRQVNDSYQVSWSETQTLLLQLPDKPGTQVTLEADDDLWLIVEYVENFGFFVALSLPRPINDHFNLIDSQLGDAITAGELCLDPYLFPRHVLVGREKMLQAAKWFFDIGKRDPSCEWILAKDAYYE